MIELRKKSPCDWKKAAACLVSAKNGTGDLDLVQGHTHQRDAACVPRGRAAVHPAAASLCTAARPRGTQQRSAEEATDASHYAYFEAAGFISAIEEAARSVQTCHCLRRLFAT